MAAITTELFDDADDLAAAMGADATAGSDAVALFALGIDRAALVPFADTVPRQTPVLLADCYGILGYSARQGRNLELMEKGRGREYGGTGGRGGKGVVAVAFSGGFAASTEGLPGDASAHMAVAANGSDTGSFLRAHAAAPYFGGVAKATFEYDRERRSFAAVPHFFVSARATVGTSSFTSDPAGAVRQLVDQLPDGKKAETVALFPCFMRGVNEYGEPDVEPEAVSEVLPGVRLYGMFCHGELGPSRCLGFDSQASPQEACRQHSMTTIVAVHASG